MKIKIGIVGFGKIGKVRFDEIEKRDDCYVTGIYEKNKSNVSVNNNVNVYENIEQLLNSGIDAVFICTFNDSLADFTTKSLNKGIHVFCEKPPARSVQELLEVKKAYNKIKNKGIKLKYGFNHRYHYSVIKANEIISEGKLGKLLWLRGVYGKAGSIDYDKNWRNYKKYSGGGILIDQGIHMLDLMRYFNRQEFVDTHSLITTSYWNIEAEDNAFVLMKDSKGVVASLHSSATQWKHKFLLEMCFEHGYINLDGILSNTRSYAPETLVTGRREFEDITYAMGKPIEKTIFFENDDSWYLEVDEFITSIKDDIPIKHGTIEDAMKTLILVENVYNNEI
jgi:predicted dehydrogenase